MTLFGWADADPVQVVDNNDYEMGTEFVANVDLTITHVRVFSGASPAAFPGRLGRIWTVGGLQLGQATLPTNLSPGWQLFALDVPVARQAGDRFIVSFNTGGAYAATPNAFDVAHNSSNGALTSRRAFDAQNGNGVFNNTPGQFPTSNFGNTFYGVDVGYDLGIGGNTAPVITNLALSASGLNVTAAITATDAETLAGATYLIDWQDGSTTTASAGSHTYASAGLKAVLASVRDAGGLSDYLAGAISLTAPASAGLLHPSNEMVAVAWLKSAVTYLGSRVATELPTDNSSWSASGFTTIYSSGGSPDVYVPERHPVISVDCFGASSQSGRPPWNLASQMAEQIRLTVLDHPNVPRALTMPTGYRSAYVRQVIPRTEPRRIRDDVASYAHYQMDLEFWWSEGP